MKERDRGRSSGGWLSRAIFVGLIGLAFTGCSLRNTAVNLIGDALSGGTGAYASDDDPELIREALPFGLKTFESLLEASPNHRGSSRGALRPDRTGLACRAHATEHRAEVSNLLLLSADPAEPNPLPNRLGNSPVLPRKHLSSRCIFACSFHSLLFMIFTRFQLVSYSCRMSKLPTRSRHTSCH
jgi:hypothetical protein